MQNRDIGKEILDGLDDISTFKKVDINTNLTELDLAKEEESKLIDNPWTMLPFK